MKKNIALALTLVMALGMTACGGSKPAETKAPETEAKTEAAAQDTEAAPEAEAEEKTFKVGICNYVDDASLNQIVDNIQTRLGEIEGAAFEICYDNCNADAATMAQIISNFQNADQVDLMVGVATPVAMAMQAATEEDQLPVVFAAVSDPEGCGLVESNAAPGANITGTSDYLDTAAVMKLMLAANPDLKKVGLLYDQGQDSSTAPIADAKAFLEANNIEYVERTGTTTDEVKLAAQALVADQVEAVFTPTDNTIMTAELAIYETFQQAQIPHYTGADSFALNGAFVGYGVDYANLGVETANLIAQILMDGADPATTPVMTFDNGTATVNTETCEACGFDFAQIKEAFAPLCTQVQEITTAESFDEVQ